ncbi:hypothetical protein ACERII_22615 [Evansella sp. AB-rgal1]|uniref:hypothetical protein n=1 Tax=Evansella sp. AB-rgal1 TaxID=3242696 RepID=UPI00359DC407
MFTDLNNKLKEVKERCRKQKKWKEHLQRANNLFTEEQKKKRDLQSLLEKEKQDVERLESFSLANIFYSITGKKLEKLEEEKREVLTAKLKYQESVTTLKDLEKEIKEYQQLLLTVKGSTEEYNQILSEKETLIKDDSTIWTQELYELLEEEAEMESMVKEYHEAVSAGRSAFNSLKVAIGSLDKAKNWSTFDMFGGGMITTAIKHSHLDEARDHIHKVQSQLRHFQEELLDIKNHFHVNLEIGNMLSFADYFFNSLIVDWMVHGKISDALNQALKMKENVSSMLFRLERDLSELEENLETVIKRRFDLLENA